MPQTLRKILLLLALILASSNDIHAQSSGKKRYFDENNIEISKSEFKKKKNTRQYLEVPGDSTKHAKLIYRQEEGTLDQVDVLYDLLAKATQRKLDTSKVLVIIYDPGDDSSNSSRTADELYYHFWYSQLEQGLDTIVQVKPVYVSKNKSGIEKSKASLPWIQDPGNTVARLFFQNYYRGGSFVVISPNGKYISYFGEFPKEYVWEAAERLKL